MPKLKAGCQSISLLLLLLLSNRYSFILTFYLRDRERDKTELLSIASPADFHNDLGSGRAKAGSQEPGIKPRTFVVGCGHLNH